MHSFDRRASDVGKGQAILPSFIIRRRLSFPPLLFRLSREKAGSIFIVAIPVDIANSASMAAQLIIRRLLAASPFLDEGVAMARIFLYQPTLLVVGCEVAWTVWGVDASSSCLSSCISISDMFWSCRLEVNDLLAERLGLLGLTAGYWPVQPPAGSGQKKHGRLLMV